LIFTITGPSGVGKTTLLEGLKEKFPDSRLLESVTDRLKRPTDVPNEYRYITIKEFNKLSMDGELLWEVNPHGTDRYGTRKAAIDEALKGGLYLSVLVVEAVEWIQEYILTQDRFSAIRSVYLLVSDEEILRQRLQGRGDVDVEKRINTCREWNTLAVNSWARFEFINAVGLPEEVFKSVLHLIPEPESR